MTEPALTGRYAQLADDLRTATKAAQPLLETEDGGTCNFDAVSVALPHWRKTKVEQAAHEAGMDCFTWTFWGIRFFVFSIRSPAKANARIRATKRIKDVLLSFDYDVGVYSSMD